MTEHKYKEFVIQSDDPVFAIHPKFLAELRKRPNSNCDAFKAYIDAGILELFSSNVKNKTPSANTA